MTRPVVVADPGMRFGAPNVRGVSYYALTDLYAAGESIERIADDFGMDRPDVLVAFWYAGMYGTRAERAWLKAWAMEQHPSMWRGEWDAVTDPPEKPARTKR